MRRRPKKTKDCYKFHIVYFESSREEEEETYFEDKIFLVLISIKQYKSRPHFLRIA